MSSGRRPYEHALLSPPRKPRPVQLYRVVGAGVARRRTHAHGLTPFVGRDDELRLLLGRWEHVREGERQVVLVLGVCVDDCDDGLHLERDRCGAHSQLCGPGYCGQP